MRASRHSAQALKAGDVALLDKSALRAALGMFQLPTSGEFREDVLSLHTRCAARHAENDKPLETCFCCFTNEGKLDDLRERLATALEEQASGKRDVA